MKIYTKTGDKGKTQLLGGSKVKKNHSRLEAYGTIDELNAYIGNIFDQKIDQISNIALLKIQNRLFDLGSNIAYDHKNSLIKLQHLDENDVLDRYYKAAKKFKADIIIRITADDPFKDFRIIDEAIKLLKKNNYDFVCNNSPVSFPEGLDVEVLTMHALSVSFLNSKSGFFNKGTKLFP